jgi:hypothetical protein
MRPAASLLRKLVSPAFRRQGFAEADIITKWPLIVGPLLADHSLPERLRSSAEGGTLTVTVEGAYGLELQHLQSVIIDRINGYFGYKAVNRLNLRQAPLAAIRAKRLKVAEPEPAAMENAAREIDPSTDDDLAEALKRLGGYVLNATPPRLKKGRD